MIDDPMKSLKLKDVFQEFLFQKKCITLPLFLIEWYVCVFSQNEFLNTEN